MQHCSRLIGTSKQASRKAVALAYIRIKFGNLWSKPHFLKPFCIYGKLSEERDRIIRQLFVTKIFNTIEFYLLKETNCSKKPKPYGPHIMVTGPLPSSATD